MPLFLIVYFRYILQVSWLSISFRTLFSSETMIILHFEPLKYAISSIMTPLFEEAIKVLHFLFQNFSSSMLTLYFSLLSLFPQATWFFFGNLIFHFKVLSFLSEDLLVWLRPSPTWSQKIYFHIKSSIFPICTVFFPPQPLWFELLMTHFFDQSH